MTIKEKLTSDRGDSTIILGLASIILVIFMAIFIVDIAKSIYIKNIYVGFAQKATLAAVKEQDAIGGLSYTSAEKLINEYMTNRTGGGNTGDTQAHRSNCELSGNYPKITITYDKTRQIGSSSKKYYSENGNIPNIPNSNKFFLNKYKAIQVDIVDVTDNYFSGIFGRPCSEMNITTSAIATNHFDAEEK